MSEVVGDLVGDLTSWTRVEELYTQHLPSAIRFAYLLTGDRLLAEDLAQEAFVKAIGRFGQLRSTAAFGAYLRTVVRNEVRSNARWSKRDRERFERHTRLTSPRGQMLTGGVERSDELRVALHDLPERQRTAIVLRFWLDLTERQIARTMRCRPGTVKSLISRGLESLRREETRD